MAPHPRTIALFDVDGTLTVPRKVREGLGWRRVGWIDPLPLPQTLSLTTHFLAGGDP